MIGDPAIDRYLDWLDALIKAEAEPTEAPQWMLDLMDNDLLDMDISGGMES